MQQQRIIHKHLTPDNIVLNPATGDVKVIDFGLATALARETIVSQPPTALAGTLAYLAPEQTGRMQRALDYRADSRRLACSSMNCSRAPCPSRRLILWSCCTPISPSPLRRPTPDGPDSADALGHRAQTAGEKRRGSVSVGTWIAE